MKPTRLIALIALTLSFFVAPSPAPAQDAQFRAVMTEAIRQIRSFQTPWQLLSSWGDSSEIRGAMNPRIEYASRLITAGRHAGRVRAFFAYHPPANGANRLCQFSVTYLDVSPKNLAGIGGELQTWLGPPESKDPEMWYYGGADRAGLGVFRVDFPNLKLRDILPRYGGVTFVFGVIGEEC